MTHGKRMLEFGDFQTPPELAGEVCRLLRCLRIPAASVVEPTCGVGHFLEAAAATYPQADLLGYEVSPAYVRAARRRLVHSAAAVRVRAADFFDVDWEDTFRRCAEPLLILGNPPWVSSARMTVVEGKNLPPKANSEGWRGIEAITGRSNFDVSEWMLRRLAAALAGKPATLAMLCKATTARKFLTHAWKESLAISRAAMYRIDALRHFGAAVDACLLIVRFGRCRSPEHCADFASLQDRRPASRFGYAGGRLVADVSTFEATRHLLNPRQRLWRSGIKHDCARVFELRTRGEQLVNGWDEAVDLEASCLYPLLKSSHLFREQWDARRYLVVTQRNTREDTAQLEQVAGKTWAYLQRHGELLDRRRSSIYRGRCRFAMFGVGTYTFSPWKIAISGLYKQLKFVLVGPRKGKPHVLDDTCYFLPCRNRGQAEAKLKLLTHPDAQAFLSSLVFWDAKRPITAEALNLLDIHQLATTVD